MGVRIPFPAHLQNRDALNCKASADSTRLNDCNRESSTRRSLWAISSHLDTLRDSPISVPALTISTPVETTVLLSHLK